MESEKSNVYIEVLHGKKKVFMELIGIIALIAIFAAIFQLKNMQINDSVGKGMASKHFEDLRIKEKDEEAK